ncbi:MAG: 4Fe-4S dicluster domain-containing protein [Coriobacteriales bacterium]|jgi:heterodisulfide reductase subunit C|nr:4Fe-4S dicluster domain-containing protein [Coriobacteriales bacterium]
MSRIDLSRTGETDLDAIARISREAAVRLADCYQCGTCSAGCPMSHEMDLTPRQLIHALQLGLLHRALEARSPWVCALCQVCSVRCPQEVRIADLMLAVRHAAKRAGLRPVREPDVFDDIFVNNIRSRGRNNEALLAGFFNLKSGHLTQDVRNAPRMAARGMISPRFNQVRDRAAVRNLVDKVLRKGGGTV